MTTLVHGARWIAAACLFAVGATIALLLLILYLGAARLELAITIDDLPVHAPDPRGATPQQVSEQMLAALKAAGVPAVYGFVNGVRLEEGPETGAVLETWHASGMMLGNHGWAHRSLNALTADAFEQELVRNEPILNNASSGTDWHWFRYPFLEEGEDAEQRQGARQVLAKHGYRVAAVTTDFSDWRWTEPYARCASAGDSAAVAELERMYLAAMKESIAVTRDNARKLYGRDIPYVLLMHVSAMSARMMPRVLQAYRKMGFHFVSLPEAERDPAYWAYTDLTLPAPPSPEEIAKEKGVKLSYPTDYSQKLAQMCGERSRSAVARSPSE